MERYARQMNLPQVGAQGQARIAAARVLVVGAGGLGCPVLHYLAAAGVGELCVVDGDVVSTSDLHRQLLYGTDDVGRQKVAVAAARLRDQGFDTRITTIAEYLVLENAMRCISGFDVVVDCTDDIPTRYLINDACVQAGKTFVHGSLYRFSGQLAVFDPLSGPTYRCAFPEEPAAGQLPDCADAGVLGTLPGVVGTMQATEVLKLLVGLSGTVKGGILLVDLLRQEFRRIAVERDPEQVSLAMRRQFTVVPDKDLRRVPEEPSTGIAAGTLRDTMHDAQEPWQCVDVRMAHETPRFAALDGHRIPMNELPQRLKELDPGRPTLVYCQQGVRSRQAAAWLREQGFALVRSLDGGVLAWQELTEAATKTKTAEP